MSFTGDLINFLVIGLPECVVITALTLAILKQKLLWRNITLIGIITSTAVLLVRALALNTGIHTAVAMIVMTMLITRLFQVTKLKSLIAVIISTLLLTLTELLIFLFCKFSLSLDIDALAHKKLFWFVTGWAQIVLLASLTLVITRTGWYRGGYHAGETINNIKAR